MNHRARRTRAEAAAQAALSGRRKPRNKLPRQVWPKGIQRNYARALLALMSDARKALAPLLEALPGLVASAAEDRRLDAGEGRRVREMIEAAQAAMAASLNTSSLDRLAGQFAANVETWQRIQMAPQVRAAFGVDVIGSDAALRAASEAFVAENVSLIKALPTRTYAEIEQLVQREVTAGALHKDIAKQINERFAIGERRAKLIARDQVGKYYGKVNQVRQQALGVERFIWRTSNDERVREEHAARDGNVYTWANAPEGGPGAPINCRCYPDPVMDDIREEPPELGDLPIAF